MTPARWTAAEQSALVWRVGGGAGRNEFVLYGDDAGERAMAKADELNARRDERLAAMVPTVPGYYWADLADRCLAFRPEVVYVTASGNFGFFGIEAEVFRAGAQRGRPLSDFTFLSGPLEPPPLPE